MREERGFQGARTAGKHVHDGTPGGLGGRLGVVVR